jgi:geranylgeranylglycerol-phosphate geranylgeranyltransferase
MNQTRITGLFRLFRLELPLSAGACVVLGEILALGSIPPLNLMLKGFLSIFFISSTALILNDYFDYEIDKINSPERPLPSGMVSKRDVVVLSIAVALAGFITASMIGLLALFVAVIVWCVGFLYNWRFKRSGIIGNLLVSFSVGMTFIFGGIAVGNPFDTIVWWFALLTMLIDLGEEIAADAGDIEGDRHAGSRSIAVVYGQRTALLVSSTIFTAVILISIVPFIFQWLQWYYLIPISIFDLILAMSTARLLHPTTVDHRRYVKWIYRSGAVMILAIIVIRLAE